MSSALEEIFTNSTIAFFSALPNSKPQVVENGDTKIHFSADFFGNATIGSIEEKIQIKNDVSNRLTFDSLNAMTLKSIECKTLTAMLKDAGYNDPTASADREKTSLKEFTAKVFKDRYRSLKSPKMTYDECLKDEARTQVQYALYPSGKTIHYFLDEILVGKAPFSSYLKLASTIGHELLHAENFVNHNMDKWFAMGFKEAKGLKKKERLEIGAAYAITMTEYQSYNWEDNVGGDSRCHTVFELQEKLSTFKFK